MHFRSGLSSRQMSLLQIEETRKTFSRVSAFLVGSMFGFNRLISFESRCLSTQHSFKASLCSRVWLRGKCHFSSSSWEFNSFARVWAERSSCVRLDVDCPVNSRSELCPLAEKTWPGQVWNESEPQKGLKMQRQ
jgi:hypothetical protein